MCCYRLIWSVSLDLFLIVVLRLFSCAQNALATPVYCSLFQFIDQRYNTVIHSVSPRYYIFVTINYVTTSWGTIYLPVNIAKKKHPFLGFS
jgi:hypothetical protein